MSRLVVSLLTLGCCVGSMSAPGAETTRPAPAPLIAADGRVIASAEEWADLRRPELLELFREHVYGRDAVGRPESLVFEREENAAPAFDGLAWREGARIRYAEPGAGGEGAIRVTAYLPAGEAGPKGCFVLIVNRSRKIIDEAEIAPREFWPVRDIVARGYVAVAFHYGDIATDKADLAFGSGVFAAFDPKGNPRAADAWGAIAAWSWGASRVVDFLAADPRLAGVPVAVVGHSRGGKAALWCGAQDTRVALAIGNDSGTTGAALARTTRGESIRRINEVFPHWFARNYHAFADRAEGLPVDQHLLLALMAPRRVYVASASEDANADPESEFRACAWAAPAFALHGLAGVGPEVFPAAGESRHDGAIGYHLRAGGHDLRREDWTRFLDYADRWLR